MVRNAPERAETRAGNRHKIEDEMLQRSLKVPVEAVALRQQ